MKSYEKAGKKTLSRDFPRLSKTFQKLPKISRNFQKFPKTSAGFRARATREGWRVDDRDGLDGVPPTTGRP
jgi:hypothetical protein